MTELDDRELTAAPGRLSLFGRPDVFQALQSVMRDVKAIGKTSVNKEQGYSFRGIDAVMSTLHPMLAEHGIIFAPTVEERLPEMRKTRKGDDMNVVHLRVRYTFYGPDGSSIEATTWGEGADMADKATNKAMTAALKYALVQVFCIATADMEDADSTTEEASRASDPATLEELDAIIDGCTTAPEFKNAYRAITTAHREGKITMEDRTVRQEPILLKVKELEGLDESVRVLGELPRNQDGKISRSQTTDEEKAAAGVMTAAQQAEHSKLANVKDPKKAERTSEPVEDEWTQPDFCATWDADLAMLVDEAAIERHLETARKAYEDKTIDRGQLGTLVAAASARTRELSEVVA
ncbi:MAG TPA: ERF family protein [Acidothermaceae bacterium]